MSDPTESASRVRRAAKVAHVGRHVDDRIKFFTIAEVAERLHVAGRTVRRWIKSEYLVVHRVGGVVRVSEGDLRAS